MDALIVEVLEASRHAERLATITQPGTPEHQAAVLADERLHALYRELLAVEGLAPPADLDGQRPPRSAPSIRWPSEEGGWVPIGLAGNSRH